MPTAASGLKGFRQRAFHNPTFGHLSAFEEAPVLGPLAVLLAAAGVFGTGLGWPDVVVAAIMAALALQGAAIVARQSLGELQRPVVIAAE
jgi:Co/Zn/Cd efflux system component